MTASDFTLDLALALLALWCAWALWTGTRELLKRGQRRRDDAWRRRW